MALARECVRLAEKLSSDARLDLFSPEHSDVLSDYAEFACVIDHLESRAEISPTFLIRTCLQALVLQYDELEPRLADVELVATLPCDAPGIARTTGGVVREMIRSAQKEIVLLGYEFTDAEVVRELSEATRRNVDTIVVCDRARGVRDRILGLWPSSVAKPRMFIDTERPQAAPHASMHAKCILVDEHDLLVTSANLTFHGLRENIEIGLRASGAVAMEARKIFSYLLTTGLVSEAL